ncbi:MAG TPA: AI-2E family transporter, partial [Myxococcota bacterium]|nr:AI-2E family transporter [Myxococcota bacterium]
DKSVSKTVRERMSEAVASVLSLAGPAAVSVSAVVSGGLVVVVLAAFFAHEPAAYAGTLRALLPREHEDAFDELWARLGRVLRQWMAGILLSMTIMGVFTGVGLAVCGVQDWFILGFLTFLGTFTPYVGAIASALPGLVLALGQSTEHFAAACGVYLLVHLIEGYLVEPMVMKRAVVIHPGTMLVWQLAMGTLFGVLGIMVATPLLACIKVTLATLYVERHLGKRLEAI